MKTVNIAVINEVSLQVVVDDREQLIPIKPVCDILGVNYTSQVDKLKEHPIFRSQVDKLKEHPIFRSTIPQRGTVAADGKEREMLCLPSNLAA